MTTEKVSYGFTFTQPITLSRHNLFEPKAFTRNGKTQGEPKYDAQFLIDPEHPELAAMKSVMLAAAKSLWPGRQFTPPFAWPISMGDKKNAKRIEEGKKELPFLNGKVVFTARSKYEVRLSYLNAGRFVDIDSALDKNSHKGKFYSGANVLVQVVFVPYKGDMGVDGVTAYLNMVGAVGGGERIGGGGASAADVFKGYVGQETATNPLDDEIPF